MSALPSVVKEAVFGESGRLPVDPIEVKGYDFNDGIDHHALLTSFRTTGFQATDFGRAVSAVNAMIRCRQRPLPADDCDTHADLNPCARARRACTLFVGYTSNMASAGVREQLRYLAEHDMVDCLVTSAGGVEEDLIKCLAPTYLGDFHLRGDDLRTRGINRTGNLLVPNSNYCRFEDWLMPILDRLLDEQTELGVNWTPSKVIDRLGAEIDDRRSIYYWCHRNRIPVFCPALTDGSLGDMLFAHAYRRPGLRVDLVEDIRRVNAQALLARHSAMLILGGGTAKHHVCNANLMRGGADHAVYINTAAEHDGSDSGARPDEAVSWGKIRRGAEAVKVYGDASVMFPLLVAETFARAHHYPEEYKESHGDSREPKGDSSDAQGNPRDAENDRT